MKFDNYQPRRLLWPVSQIDVQRIMLGFLVEGHIYIYICALVHLCIPSMLVVIYTCMWCIFLCVGVCTFMCVCVSVRVCTYVCMCVHMCL